MNKMGGAQLPRAHVPQSGDESPEEAESMRTPPAHEQ
jgi:hypothetical protein